MYSDIVIWKLIQGPSTECALYACLRCLYAILFLKFVAVVTMFYNISTSSAEKYNQTLSMLKTSKHNCISSL